MDDILKLQTELIEQKKKLRNLTFSLDVRKDQMTLEVEKEYKVTKDSMLSNAELRKLTARERLLCDQEYIEEFTQMLDLTYKVEVGEAMLGELQRDFVRTFCQNKLPI